MKHDIPTPQAGNGLTRILRVMKQLRDPEDGCPWDVKQSFATIAPYTVEEAYEVADAIERDDWVDLKEELGDLLLQVVFHAQMAQEAGLFDFDDVAHGIADKMVHRHPHVFEDTAYPDEAAQKADWDRIKTEEKRAKQAAKAAAGLTTPDVDSRATLQDIPSIFPALLATDKIQRKAARVGFDHPEMHDWIVPKEMNFDDACRGVYKDEYLSVSHRWLGGDLVAPSGDPTKDDEDRKRAGEAV